MRKTSIETALMVARTRREIKYGNDFLLEIIAPNSNKKIKVTYWDLWIAIILSDIFDNHLGKMIDYLRSKSHKSSHLRNNFEAIASHIRLLHQSYLKEKLYITDILVGIDPDFIKKQKIKAKRKILEMGFQSQEKSNWMINTPRKLHEVQAMRGHWHLFPANPNNHAISLEILYKSTGFYNKEQSFKLEKKLAKYLDKNITKASHSELLALYRAFLTVVIEKMDMVDDSYGVIGDLYEDALKTYFLLDRNKLHMEPIDFFLDLIELLIWEDYGFTYNYKPEIFDNLTSTEIPLVASIFQQQIVELNNLELNYQAKKAVTMLRML